MRWVPAVLAACAAVIALTVFYADRTLFDADGFADRAVAATRSPPVRSAIGRQVADAAISAKPDLVAVRPLLQTATEALVSTEAFRSLLRGAARDVHRSAFDQHANTVTLSAGDAGILLAEALRSLQPQLAARIPESLNVHLETVSGSALRVTEAVERVRRAGLIAAVAALLLAVTTALVSRTRRDAVFRLGASLAVVGGLAAALTRIAFRSPVADVWLDPLTWWLAAAALTGLVAALAAAAVLRPLPSLVPLLRVPPAPVLVVLGLVTLLWPLVVLRVAGALALAEGLSGLLRRVAGPEPARPSFRRPLRLAAVVAGVAGGVFAAAALAGGKDVVLPRTDRCNGSAALCDRPLNDVAFVGTHNSMSADNEPGWLFAAQDAGIPAQLDAGVRALLIDTHYGFKTPRGVATDLSGESKSRAKIEDTVSKTFVDTAERLRKRIGYAGGGKRDVFLCHAFCEVGATRAVDALTQVHRFLVAHPEEVLILSIEDDTDPADTAAVIRRSGLIDEVYRGPAKPPWPTLRELIARDERVLVLLEYHAGGEPWMHDQQAAMQETPFHFSTAAALSAATSCDPNRGGTAGSLFLVNHWVDTSPAPRKTIARQVNARAFLDERLQRCRKQRGLLPTVVAIDFYEQGDVFGAVADLNHP